MLIHQQRLLVSVVNTDRLVLFTSLNNGVSMKEVGSYEAKTHLPELLNQVTKGERITITKHGIPIAMIVPFAQSRSKQVASAIAKIKQMRKKLTLGGLSVRDLINEGRRF